MPFLAKFGKFYLVTADSSICKHNIVVHLKKKPKMITPATKAKYLKEFNDREDFPFTFTSPRTVDVFCKICESTFSGGQKELFKQHLKSAKHGKNKELKRKRTATQALLSEVLPSGAKEAKSK